MGTLGRRDVLRGATAIGAGAVALPLLAGCGGGGTNGGGSTGGGGSGGTSGVTVAKSKVPVGGGTVDGSVVVTQPTAGQFKAFSSTCTHMGCTVGGVQDGFIVCPCHGSHFAIATGDPTPTSPAKVPLPAKTVTVDGDNLVIT
ncbi:MAG TPA: Rieske (2Fe-2S) protein [Actinomycetes bacterium]|nr:Rieske (2Fe-2S) protein [Actinomycetes bacterium]